MLAKDLAALERTPKWGLRALDEALKAVGALDIEMLLFYDHYLALQLVDDYSELGSNASQVDRHMCKMARKIKKCTHFKHY